MFHFRVQNDRGSPAVAEAKGLQSPYFEVIAEIEIPCLVSGAGSYASTQSQALWKISISVLKQSCFRAVLDTELLKHLRIIMFNSFLAQSQLLGDVSVAHALRH
jgi:hypothetical protein